MQATGIGIKRYQTGIVPDYDHYSKQHLIPDLNLKAHKPARKISRGSVVMQDDALTCSETALM